MRATSRCLLALTALLGAGALVAARPAAAADGQARLQMGAHVAPRVLVSADRRDLALAPGESATVMVSVKARIARGASVAIVLEAPGDGTALRYAFQGQAGRLAGPTTLGLVTGSGVHRLPLTVTLEPSARRPVRLPLALRAGGGATVVAGATVTHVSP